MHRLHGCGRDRICHAVCERGRRQDGYQYAGAARIVVYVQTRLARVVVRANIGPIVVMMMTALLIMGVIVMVVAMMHMTSLIRLMDVKQNAGERSGRRRVGHADDGREGKHERRRPNEGSATSPRLLQSRQHRLRLVPSTIVTWRF